MEEPPEEILEGYTRVSEILRPWNDFSMVLPEVLDHKMKIGTLVHKMIHLHNESVIVPQEFEGREYFDSFMAWLELTQGKVVLSEQRMYDDFLKITGKIDALVQFPNEDKPVLVDWKTSSSCGKKTALSWKLQGTMYHYLLSKNRPDDSISDRFLFVRLNSEGGLPSVKEFTFDSSMMEICSSALEIYRYFNPLQ